MSADTLTILRELQKKPENRVCVDCDTKNPQWASVSYGTFMCLECSGQHRGLSVQISFVRSVTMDSWSAIQLKKMQCGGNEQLNDIMQQYGLSKHTPIKEKYFSKVAEVCREKLLADIEGRAFTMPSVADMQEAQRSSSAQAGGGGSRVPSAGRGQQGKAAGGAIDWQDWDDKGAAQGGRPAEGKGEYSRSALEASAAGKDSFFASKMAENSFRPEGVAPSQGGKYVGFGSAPGPSASASGRGNSKGVDEVTSLFSQGWNQLSSVAEAAAKTAAGAVKSGSQHLNNPQMHDQMSQNAKAIRERAGEYASMGFGTLKSFYTSVASTVESAAKSRGLDLQLGTAHGGASSSGGGYNSSNGESSSGYGRRPYGGDERSADKEPTPNGGQGGGSYGGSSSARQDVPRTSHSSTSGFEGFGGADADDWGGSPARSSPARAQLPPTSSPSKSDRSSMPQSHSSPELASRAGGPEQRQSAGGTPAKPASNLSRVAAEKDDDEWGKW